MANPTQVLIATQTITSNTATFSFTSIPQTYTDLKLVMSARSTFSSPNAAANVTFNSTTTGYAQCFAEYIGASTTQSAVNSSRSAFDRMYINGNTSTSGTFSNTEVYIPGYTSSNAKCVSISGYQENNSSTLYANIVGMMGGVSTVTAAVTSIVITEGNGYYFMPGSNFYLYGIKNS